MRRWWSGPTLRLLSLFRTAQPGPQPDAEPARIAVVRFGGLGDVVVATGLLQSLRHRWPRAEIIVASSRSSVVRPSARATISDQAWNGRA